LLRKAAWSVAVCLAPASLVLSLACAGTSNLPASASTGDSDIRPSLRAEAFVEHGWAFDLGDSRQMIVERLGEPVATRVAEVPNPHLPETRDTVYTLTYDGLEVEIYRATAVDRHFLSRLSVSGSRYAMRWDLRVGSAAQKVRETLGSPTDLSGDSLIYEAGEGATDRVIFTIEDGRVRMIEWHFYVD
jgi:hypothetical protein